MKKLLIAAAVATAAVWLIKKMSSGRDWEWKENQEAGAPEEVCDDVRAAAEEKPDEVKTEQPAAENGENA